MKISIESLSLLLDRKIQFILMIILSILLYYILKIFLLKYVKELSKKTKNKWDDAIFETKFLDYSISLFPLAVLYQYSSVLGDYQRFFQKSILIVSTFILYLIISNFLDALLKIYSQYPISKKKPIKGYIQIIKIFLFVIISIVTISILFNTSPWKFLSGIGALTAVVMLIFKDTILSFIASLQLSSLDLMHEGDWIEIPKFGVDGEE